MAYHWDYELGQWVIELSCQCCGEKFKAARYHAKYCSVKCRVKASRERKKNEQKQNGR